MKENSITNLNSSSTIFHLVIGTLNQSASTSFKTPVVPQRKGNRRNKSRSEINHNYDPSFETFINNLSANQQTHSNDIHQSSKKLNKRKTFKCTTPFTSENLVIAPAVDMIYKLSKRPREVDLQDEEVFNQPKRRRLETMPRQSFRNQNFIRVDDKISCQQIFRLFGMEDTDVREKKNPDKNENLLQPKELNVGKLSESIPVLDDDQLSSNFLNSSNDKLTLSIEEQPIHIKIEEKWNVSDYEKNAVTQDDKLDSSEKSINVSDINSYASQIVWSRSSKFPYWPSIVCPSEIGVIQENRRVHVRFCANKGSSGWVNMKNIFEFDGIESFMKKKQSMQSNIRTKPERNEFQLAFNVKKYKSWPKSVVEGMFIIQRPSEERHAFFDILFMLSACQSSKSSLQLSEIISELSTSPLITAEELFKDNSNICEEIKDELNRLTDHLDFKDLNLSVFKEKVASPDKGNKRERPKIVPAALPSDKLRRKSRPYISKQ